MILINPVLIIKKKQPTTAETKSVYKGQEKSIVQSAAENFHSVLTSVSRDGCLLDTPNGKCSLIGLFNSEIRRCV